MIKTIFTIDSVPSTWIFEYYCKLTEKLHGQDIKISSIFKPEERTPSMCIYYHEDQYKFKDFSSGKAGRGVNLVMEYFNLSYYDAINKIYNDYHNRVEIDEHVEIKKVSGYKVTSHLTRNWNELDAKYWTKFGIGSLLLKKYNVFPLSSYCMTKEVDGEIKEIFIKGEYIYGYFTNDGELFKIYQPHRVKKKFINVVSYIQGSEQLTYSKPLLVICSSLKDMMALDALKFNVECVAPSSENTMLPKSFLSACACKYKGILVFFDNDEAGKNAMLKYEEKYGIQGIYLKMSKDLSDSIKDFGIRKTKQYLTPLIPKI